MNTAWKFFLIFVAVVLILGYFIVKSPTKEPYNENQANTEIQNQNSPQPEDSFPNAKGMHWTHMPVTYSFENISACGKGEPSYVIRAFNEIQSETNSTVRFKQVDSGGDIIINCKKDFNMNNTSGTYRVGDALITNSEGNRIYNGELNFYIVSGTVNAGSCGYANIEVHEILHTFGFEHTFDKNNIMNQVVSYCPNHLNEDILDKLFSAYRTK